MPKDAKRVQRSALKRRQRQHEVKRKKIVRQIKEENRAGNRTIRIDDLPIDECVISRGWEERGLAHILVTRSLGDGQVLMGGYFVDVLCLGLKDTAVIPRVDREEYLKDLKNSIFNDPVEFEKIDPAFARGLVEGAIAYAQGMGFRANRRWADSQKAWRGIEAKKIDFQFGRGGKPCLILRKGENLRGALARLERTLKPGEYEIVDQRDEM